MTKGQADSPARSARIVVLVGSPAVLAVLELFHPSYSGDAASELLPVADRWVAVHLAQILLFPLLAASLWLLVSGLRHSRLAQVARAGALGFAVFAVAFDATAGLATAFLALHADGLAEPSRTNVLDAIDALFTHPIVGADGVLAVTASAGWLAGTVAAAAAFAQARAPAGAVVLLVVSGFVFALGHTPPTAQIGLGAYLGAVVWLQRSSN